MADNNLIVARLMRRENGRMTVCPCTREFLCLRLQKEERSGRTHAPLSVVSEDCIRLTEREELFPGLGLFVHIRVELLAQLQSPPPKKNIYSKRISHDYSKPIATREAALIVF